MEDAAKKLVKGIRRKTRDPSFAGETFGIVRAEAAWAVLEGRTIVIRTSATGGAWTGSPHHLAP